MTQNSHTPPRFHQRAKGWVLPKTPVLVTQALGLGIIAIFIRGVSYTKWSFDEISYRNLMKMVLGWSAGGAQIASWVSPGL